MFKRLIRAARKKTAYFKAFKDNCKGKIVFFYSACVVCNLLACGLPVKSPQGLCLRSSKMVVDKLQFDFYLQLSDWIIQINSYE